MKKLLQGLLLLTAVSGFFCYAACGHKKQTAVSGSAADSSASASASRVSPADSGAPAYGIDISKYQGDIVADIISKDGLSFAICKATEGETYTDPDFASNWAAIKQKGLLRGAYHFYHTDDNAVTQARFFIQTLKAQGLDGTDIPPVLDIETGSLSTGVTVAQVQNDALTFLTQVEQLSGRTPVLYSSLYFANTYLADSRFARYPLWIAEYSGGKTPVIPTAWQQNGYIIWQRSPSYTIDSDTTDYDVFNGTRGALYRFVQDN